MSAPKPISQSFQLQSEKKSHRLRRRQKKFFFCSTAFHLHFSFPWPSPPPHPSIIPIRSAGVRILIRAARFFILFACCSCRKPSHCLRLVCVQSVPLFLLPLPSSLALSDNHKQQPKRSRHSWATNIHPPPDAHRDRGLLRRVPRR